MEEKKRLEKRTGKRKDEAKIHVKIYPVLDGYATNALNRFKLFKSFRGC